MRNPDTRINIERLKDKYRILETYDYTDPKYDFDKLYAEHSSDLIGFYITKLNKKDSSEAEKKALFYGIDALLKTTSDREVQP